MAILDANVLVQRHLRDLLLHAALHGKLYDARWSDTILEEMQRTLLRLGSASERTVASLVMAMCDHFPLATVADYEPLVARMTNDMKDRHVAAAAVHARADIVTFNKRDFPPADLAPFGIRAFTPDAFLLELFDAEPDTLTEVLRTLVSERQYASITVDAFLGRLERGTPRFVAAMRGHRGG